MFEQDDDEKFRQMLGGIIGQGPAPYDVQTSMEQPDAPPEQSQLSAPYMPGAAPGGGLGGYTPPPPAAAPTPLDHVQGHQFGGGDVAMLGGILAALLGGGKHRGEIAGSLAGQYGGAVMQNNARADQRNQQVDTYNNQLENKANDPLERWKADQTAKYQVGSLKTRGDELDLQKTREQRIADAQTAESMKDPAAEAKLIAEARAGVDLDTTRKKNDMEVGTREMLGEILGRQKGEYAAPVKGKNGEPIPLTPEKELKRRLAENAIKGMDDGSVNPLTGKPTETPKTPAALAGDAKRNSRLVPFDGTEVDNPDLWGSTMSTDNIREKIRKDDATLAGAIPALQDMFDIRKKNGAETGFGKDSGEVTGRFNVASGKVESALGVLKNIGVISPTEAANLKDTIPGLSPSLSDVTRMVPESMGGGDTKLGKLQGAQKEFTDLIERARKSYGLKTKSGGGGGENDLGGTDSGIKFSVDPKAEAKFNEGGFGPGDSTGKPGSGGKRMVTVTAADGRTAQQELSEDEINELRSDKRVKSVQ